MGIFKRLKEESKKEKEFLLQWQNVVVKDKTDKLFMTRQQLHAITIQQAENDLRIVNDCAKIANSTIKPDVFFMRLNLMVEKAKHLCELEPYISFDGVKPTAAYNEIIKEYPEAIQQFLIRYFSDTFDKAEAMKTEKGKINKYQKFYDSLQEHYRYMNDENIDFVETKYKAYTRICKGGDAEKNNKPQ